jgi:S1-C subfamily serine protease
VLSQRSLGQLIPDGVVVRELVRDTPAAAEKMLQLDRIITKVNGVPVMTPDEFYRAVERAGNRVDLTVINSDRQPEIVTLEK